MEQSQNSFVLALNLLLEGKAVTRSGWNAHHKLLLQVPDANSKMTQPYIYMVTAQGAVLPWVASQTDLLATDWLEDVVA